MSYVTDLQTRVELLDQAIALQQHLDLSHRLRRLGYKPGRYPRPMARAQSLSARASSGQWIARPAIGQVLGIR